MVRKRVVMVQVQMPFVNKFYSHRKSCNITYDIPDLVFKSVCIFNVTQQMFACSKSTIRTKIEICSQLAIKTLEWRHWHRSGVLILNFEQFLDLFLMLQLLTLNRWLLAGMLISQTKPLKIKSFVPLNFAITNICVAICLAEDETRMGGI